jgi:hypothetical protein
VLLTYWGSHVVDSSTLLSRLSTTIAAGVNKPSMCSVTGVPTAAQANCPHTKTWFYTVNDGWLAAACQGALPVTTTNTALKTEMSK